MRLNFDFPYEDYSDSKNWPPRLKELKAIAAELGQTSLTELSDTAILDRLEEVEELMRYYTAVSDYQNLETVMRLQYRLIQQGEKMGLSCIAFRYFRLEFERINAILYRADGQNRKSAEGYASACDIAKQCIYDLRSDESLDGKQKLYVGWACQEVLNEAAQVFDSVVDYTKTIECGNQILSLLQWLEPYMAGSANIQDKTADIYCSYGGIFFQNGDADNGRICYRSSIRIFEDLSKEYDSDFWYARSLWAMAHYGLQEFLCTADASIMLECERKSRLALKEIFTKEREIAIAEAAIALISIQKGVAYQQGDDLDEAIQHTKQGVSLCNSSLNKLKNVAGNKNVIYRAVIESIAARIYASYIGALDSLGVQLYMNDQHGAAKETFEELLALLTKPSEYAVSEVAGTLTRAECLNYMALLSMEEGNTDAVEFYAEQSAALTSNLAKKVNNAAVLQVESFACSLLAEYYLGVKNKPKALKYAEMGLSACEDWQRLAPQNGTPDIVPLLEKFKKKASRRFF